MTPERRQTTLFALGLAAVLGLGGGMLVWPNYRQTRAIDARIAQLREKVSGLSGTNEEVERLAGVLCDSRRRIEEELRTIPGGPDMADLIRNLSLPVDGATVLDQTFTAGHSTRAAADEDCPLEAMPLTVEMEASFDSVYALLQAAESMRRLVRIASIRMVCEREKAENADLPFITASVGLEAIYEPDRPGAP